MTNPAVGLPTLNEYIKRLNAEVKRRLVYLRFAERTASAVLVSDAKSMLSNTLGRLRYAIDNLEKNEVDISVLSVCAPDIWAAPNHRPPCSGGRQNVESDRAPTDVPPAPRHGGNMSAHSGSAAGKVSEFVETLAIACC
jgi:hypothetical protein